MEDEEYLAFVAYLDENRYPDGCTKMQKRSLRLRSSSFRVTDGVLFRVDQDQHDRPVAKVVEVDPILRDLHSNSVGGGHFGMNATVEKVSQRYWWKGFSSSTWEFVEKLRNLPEEQPFQQGSSIYSAPYCCRQPSFQQMGYRFDWAPQRDKNGNRYDISVAISCSHCDCCGEYLTKWPELGALPNKDGSGVAKFIENIVYRFGDGLTEMFNQTLIAQLRKTTDGQDWDEHLQAIVFSYRVGQQASTKMSPFRLMYGVQPRLPIDLELPSG